VFGFGAGRHQSQSVGPVSLSGPFEHSSRYASLAASPLPALVLHIEGSRSGGVPVPGPVMLPAVPSEPRLLNQQFPVLPENSSHQKSVPLGWGPGPPEWALPNRPTAAGKLNPGGGWPMRFAKKWLPHEVEMPLSGAPGHEIPGLTLPSAGARASGMAISIVPLRQLWEM